MFHGSVTLNTWRHKKATLVHREEEAAGPSTRGGAALSGGFSQSVGYGMWRMYNGSNISLAQGQPRRRDAWRLSGGSCSGAPNIRAVEWKRGHRHVTYERCRVKATRRSGSQAYLPCGIRGYTARLTSEKHWGLQFGRTLDSALRPRDSGGLSWRCFRHTAPKLSTPNRAQYRQGQQENRLRYQGRVAALDWVLESARPQGADVLSGGTET